MTFRLWRCFSAGGTPRWSSSAEPNIPGYFPQAWGLVQGSSADSRTELASQKNVSSKQRKSFRRSVLHRAALAAPSLPPPKNGSLRQAAQACVQRLQAASASPVDPHSAKKRPLSDSPSALSPSNLLPLAQRIRTDIQIGESENESPEKLRSTPCPLPQAMLQTLPQKKLQALPQSLPQALRWPKQKNGDYFLSPTTPQNGVQHVCFLCLSLLGGF